MREDFWDATEGGTSEDLAERAEEAFSFIVEHGGVPSRWRSFWIITDVFLAQLAAMRFFAKSDFPSLIFLETIFEGPYEHDGEDESTMESEMISPPKLLFKKSPPQLRVAKLQGVPISYLFGHHAHPQLIGLTHLELCFVATCPHLLDLNKMLAANPNLETLKFDSDLVIQVGESDRKIIPQVHLPKLQSLSFVSVASSIWTLQAITMLDAPNVTSFELVLGIWAYEPHHKQAGIRKLFDHITGETSQSTPAPRFPSLRSLTLASEISLGFEQITARVLAAYPELTKLTLPICPSLSPCISAPGSFSTWSI